MITAVVNVVANLKAELLTDASGTPVTTKVNGDWTKAARLLGSATTTTPTITHKANGVYDIAFTPTAVGNWSVEYSVVVDGETVYFDPQFVQVIPAAADPAAIADAIAGIMDQSSAGYDAGTIGYEIHALFKRPVGSG